MNSTEPTPIKIERRGGRRKGAGRKKNPEKRVQLSALVPPDLLTAVTEGAVREGVSRSEFLTRALYKFFGKTPM